MFILQTQNVANLHTTPPLLEAIARNDAVVDLVNEKIRYLLLSGAHVDADTLDLLRDIFPYTTITMAFGSTMVLSQAVTRTTDDHTFVFDPRTPYVVFWVVDPDTGEQVPYGQLGQVVMNHISKGMFIPNNLERDMAIRMPGPGRARQRFGQRGAAGDHLRGRGRHRRRVLIVASEQASLTADLVFIDALGPNGEYRTRNREVITTYSRRAGCRAEPGAAAVRLAHHRRATQGRGHCRSHSAKRRWPMPPMSSRPPSSPDSTSRPMLAWPAGFRGCRSRLPAPERAASPTPSPRRSMRCGRPGRRARPSTGARSAPATAVRYGRGAARCSRCTPPETAPACTACGPRRSRSATGSRCARRAASH